MKLKLESELDDDKVFGNVPEAERTDEMREYVRSSLEDFYGVDEDNNVTDALLMRAGGEIDTYLEQVRGRIVNVDEVRDIPQWPIAAETVVVIERTGGVK